MERPDRGNSGHSTLSGNEPNAVARDILSYFLRNPQAADDLEGIAHWRLLHETVYRTVDETRAALAELVESGLLLQTSRAGLDPIFMLNPATRGEAARRQAALARAALPRSSSDEAKMAATTLDDMTNPGLWQALEQDGVTPSTEISLALDQQVRFGSNPSSARLSATSDALNHTLRRSLGQIDLTNLDEIRLWLYSDRAADGTPPRRFYLEMRLASATLALNDPNNTWRRYLPVSQVATWERVRLTLGDLPAAVRGALTTIQLRCANATAAFNCHFDAIIAVRDAMIVDVDNALRASLDGILSVNGKKIPAVLHPANAVQTQTRPYIEILQYDAHFSRERTDSASARGDFTDQGYSLRPPANAYELFYQVTAVADDRPTQSAMLEFMLRTLPARGQLLVNGDPLPMEAIDVQPIDQIGGFRTDQIPLFYKISTRLEVGLSVPLRPVKSVLVSTDLPSK
jgi:hypothetical protein